jgi:hypothetical protein
MVWHISDSKCYENAKDVRIPCQEVIRATLADPGKQHRIR